MYEGKFVELGRVVLNRTSYYMWHRVDVDFFTGVEECNRFEIFCGAALVFTSTDYQEAQDEFARLAQEAFKQFIETPAHVDGLR